MTYRERLRLIRARIALHQRQALAQDRVRPHHHGRAGRLVVAVVGVLTLLLLLAWTADLPIVVDLNLMIALLAVGLVVNAWSR